MTAQCPHCGASSLVIDWPRTDVAVCILCAHRFKLAGARAQVEEVNRQLIHQTAVFIVKA